MKLVENLVYTPDPDGSRFGTWSCPGVVVRGTDRLYTVLADRFPAGRILAQEVITHALETGRAEVKP